MKKNIVLIGMPASGKSTVGVILAKVLGMDFIDADLVIQKKTGKLLSEIIADKGVDGFIQTENEINSQIEAENAVIATGGSAVYGKEEMEHLGKDGIIFYLKVAFEELSERLGNIKERGVVVRKGQTLKDLYDERVVLYEKYADATIDEQGKNVEQIVIDVAAKWQEMS
ncbi:MAG: shikimate kinase [Lachnospiraceae bacterium]|nr:shikimate kinase [Lachnospiraceae bacterium]